MGLARALLSRHARISNRIIVVGSKWVSRKGEGSPGDDYDMLAHKLTTNNIIIISPLPSNSLFTHYSDNLFPTAFTPAGELTAIINPAWHCHPPPCHHHAQCTPHTGTDSNINFTQHHSHVLTTTTLPHFLIPINNCSPSQNKTYRHF